MIQIRILWYKKTCSGIFWENFQALERTTGKDLSLQPNLNKDSYGSNCYWQAYFDPKKTQPQNKLKLWEAGW